MRAMLVTAILVALQPIEASAFMIMGAGVNSSCGKWLSERSKGTHFDEANWALGYLSGAASNGPAEHDPLGKTDSDGVLYWLDNYCRANPTVGFHEAVKAFYRAHTK
jgi:hypothetical protein